jgi:predicted DCC family thiol-disulfide oxidoreductase YuxK
MRIVFFDGNCPMCHAWVKRFIRWDKNKVLRFSPLDGETAKQKLSPVLPEYLSEDTIVYYDNGKVYLRSDAAFNISQTLGFPYHLMAIGKIVPKFIRDTVYRKIASNRYQFGKRFDACPLPPEEWKELFLK